MYIFYELRFITDASGKDFTNSVIAEVGNRLMSSSKPNVVNLLRYITHTWLVFKFGVFVGDIFQTISFSHKIPSNPNF